jgi:hypothetical protein
MLCLCCSSVLPALSKQPAGPADKQRPASAIEWEVREVNHPRMGPIKVAVPTSSIATPVGNDKIVSLVFFSCEKTQGKVAIELANAPQSDGRAGLPPKQMPRLVCYIGTAKSELATSWLVSDLGDALARGLSPSALRRCASIEVLQNIALPKGWARGNERVRIELKPSNEAIDSVLTECGATPSPATSTAATPTPATPATATSAPATPAPATPAKAAAAESWKPARTIAKGRTNVRASPDLDSAVVIRLDPGARVLVQPSSGDWWKAKPATGEKFHGYIREDRLVFD